MEVFVGSLDKKYVKIGRASRTTLPNGLRNIVRDLK